MTFDLPKTLIIKQPSFVTLYAYLYFVRVHLVFPYISSVGQVRDDLREEGEAPGARGSQVMRKDVGVSGGIGQIIPELSYIIQISFFCATPPPLLSVITALSSGTLSLADSRFKQI